MLFSVFFVVLVVLVGVHAQLEALKKNGQCATGNPAAKGDKVGVHYSGYIDKSSASGVHGKMFDSSLKRGPFEFTLGANQVIKGWEQGVLGMCLGEKKTLTIPPELAYGDRGAGNDIPGGATLKFVVDMMSINANKIDLKHTEDPNVFNEMDSNRDLEITHAEMEAWFSHMHPDKLTAVPEGLFAREDKNGDQVISWEEFDGPKGDVRPQQ